MTELTLIIPAKNEKDHSRSFENIKKYNYEIIVSLQKNDFETIQSIRNFDVKIHEQAETGYGNSHN